MLVLTEADVRAASDLPMAIERVRATLADHSAGRTDTPVRAEIRIPERGVLGLFMPSHVPNAGALGAKVIAEFPSNRDHGLPVLTGSLSLLDYETGLVDTLMAATHLTNLRTGALTAVAAAALAPAGSRTAAVLGTGGLAPLQALALAQVLDLEEIRVWGRRRERAGEVLEAVTSAGARGEPDVMVAPTAREAIADADVVVTATSAHTPIVEPGWVVPTALVCAVGSNAPGMQELPSRLVGEAHRVVVDSRAGVVERAGDIVVPIAEGLLDPGAIEELGEVVSAPGAAGRRRGDGVVVFKSCGFAALDIALAAEIRERARSLGRGLEVDLGQTDG